MDLSEMSPVSTVTACVEWETDFAVFVFALAVYR